MTSVTDKIKQLRAMVGNKAVEDILAHADLTQKELDAEGVTFKDGNNVAEEVVDEVEATKAGKVPSQFLSRKKKPVEEGMDEDVDDELDGDDEDEEELETGKDKEFSDLYMTDLTVKEFGDLLADVLNAALAPETTKEADELKAQVAALQAENKTLKEKIQQEAVSVPRAFKNAASQSPNTVISDEKAKQYPGPQGDNGVAAFFTDFVLPPGQ
jgi:hypothetical protein